jgi:hypothetical protein
MATLLSVILVTSSPNLGPTWVFAYPPAPRPTPRLSRPIYSKSADVLDAQRRSVGASSSSDDEDLANAERWGVRFVRGEAAGDSSEEERDEAMRRANSAPEYGRYLGDFDNSILAGLLTPRREMCDKKFEMVIDALSFIGHPVWLGRKGEEIVEYEDRGRARMRSRGTEPPEASSVVDHGSPASLRGDVPLPDIQQVTLSDPFAPQPSNTSTRSTSAAPVGRVRTASPSVNPTADMSRQPSSSANSAILSPPLPPPLRMASTESFAHPPSPKAKPRKRDPSQGTLESFNLVLVIDTPPDQHLSSHLDVYYRYVSVLELEVNGTDTSPIAGTSLSS